MKEDITSSDMMVALVSRRQLCFIGSDTFVVESS